MCSLTSADGRGRNGGGGSEAAVGGRFRSAGGRNAQHLSDAARTYESDRRAYEIAVRRHDPRPFPFAAGQPDPSTSSSNPPPHPEAPTDAAALAPHACAGPDPARAEHAGSGAPRAEYAESLVGWVVTGRVVTERPRGSGTEDLLRPPRPSLRDERVRAHRPPPPSAPGCSSSGRYRETLGMRRGEPEPGWAMRTAAPSPMRPLAPCSPGRVLNRRRERLKTSTENVNMQSPGGGLTTS